MADTYFVMLDNGSTDGPYSLEELRERLHTGRVRSADRLTHTKTRVQCQLVELIPDAQDISHARPTVSERIRRKTSDRHAVAQAAANRSSGRTPAVPVLTAPAPAEYLAAGKAVSPVSPGAGRARPAWARPWVGVIAVVVILAVIWSQLPAFGGGGLTVGVVAGRWKTGSDTTIPALKNAELILSREDLTINQGGMVRTLGISLAASDARLVVVELKPIDHDLGQFLQFEVVQGGLRLVATSGTAALTKL
jgi:hypothetical protein